MKELGWDRKKGVKIIFGRWQDSLDQLEQYDGIFFDTYSEYYDDLRYQLASLLQIATFSCIERVQGEKRMNSQLQKSSYLASKRLCPSAKSRVMFNNELHQI